MPKPRKHFGPEEQVTILHRHLVEKVLVSTVCEEACIQRSLFYQWQKQFFEFVLRNVPGTSRQAGIKNMPWLPLVA